jgi:hypothetical protein
MTLENPILWCLLGYLYLQVGYAMLGPLYLMVWDRERARSFLMMACFPSQLVFYDCQFTDPRHNRLVIGFIWPICLAWSAGAVICAVVYHVCRLAWTTLRLAGEMVAALACFSVRPLLAIVDAPSAFARAVAMLTSGRPTAARTGGIADQPHDAQLGHPNAPIYERTPAEVRLDDLDLERASWAVRRVDAQRAQVEATRQIERINGLMAEVAAANTAPVE